MQIQQDNFIKKLLSLEKGRAHIPDLRKKRTWYLKKLTDAKLVKYTRRGNSHAFDVLVRRHEGKIKQIIRAALFDKSFTDDVMQDVLEKVVHHLRSRGYRETGKFYGWLSTLAFRQAMNVNRQKLYNPETVEYDPSSHNVEETSTDDEMTESILAEAKAIMATFSERDQRIMHMHYYEGCSFEAIAKKLNLSPGGVRAWHSLSLKKLRKRMSVSNERKYA